MLTFLGWIAALGLLALTVSSAWHGYRDKARGSWVAAGLYSCGAVIMLAIDGALSAMAAGVLAFLALAAAAGLALADGRKTAPDIPPWKAVAWSARFHAGGSLGRLGHDIRSLWQRLRGQDDGGGPAPEGSPQAVVAEAVQARGIPSVMEDPHLGPAPEPADLASPGIPVPAPWAALAEYIRSREPADDMELRILTEGDAAGALAVADARHAFADTCLNTIGLDPAYVAGVMETGDSMAEHASMLTQVHKRFGVIYAAVKDWIDAHGPLPKNARDWLTGS